MLIIQSSGREMSFLCVMLHAVHFLSIVFFVVRPLVKYNRGKTFLSVFNGIISVFLNSVF